MKTLALLMAFAVGVLGAIGIYLYVLWTLLHLCGPQLWMLGPAFRC